MSRAKVAGARVICVVRGWRVATSVGAGRICVCKARYKADVNAQCRSGKRAKGDVGVRSRESRDGVAGKRLQQYVEIKLVSVVRGPGPLLYAAHLLVVVGRAIFVQVSSARSLRSAPENYKQKAKSERLEGKERGGEFE